ncbi:MAG: hypothetical protein MI923_27605 [Phycisphaerales bacterium]|nr:hypothetical protein [Phycisphaerales bacterium]
MFSIKPSVFCRRRKAHHRCDERFPTSIDRFHRTGHSTIYLIFLVGVGVLAIGTLRHSALCRSSLSGVSVVSDDAKRDKLAGSLPADSADGSFHGRPRGIPQGDVNGDNHVNGLDIQPFVAIVLNAPICPVMCPDSEDQCCRADHDDDGFVTVENDLPNFISSLLASP